MGGMAGADAEDASEPDTLQPTDEEASSGNGEDAPSANGDGDESERS